MNKERAQYPDAFPSALRAVREGYDIPYKAFGTVRGSYANIENRGRASLEKFNEVINALFDAIAKQVEANPEKYAPLLPGTNPVQTILDKADEIIKSPPPVIPPNRKTPMADPSLEEIKREAARIRAEWSPKERAERGTGRLDSDNGDDDFPSGRGR